jgi:hypothetical protein
MLVFDKDFYHRDFKNMKPQMTQINPDKNRFICIHLCLSVVNNFR